MQTHVRDDARGIEIAAGFELDPLEVRDQDLQSSGYLATGRPRSDGATRLSSPMAATRSRRACPGSPRRTS